MKVQINVKPRFYLEPDIKTVKALMACASRHYDASCRHCALYGEFLHGWLVRLEVGCEIIGADWHELDLLAKVCEGAPYEPAEAQALLREFALKIHTVYQTLQKSGLNSLEINLP
jgi:hypothetical protein